MTRVSVAGAGLAGCEAAWQIARRGVPVTLYEMKPARRSPAHTSDDFCELVCSNSLRGADLACAPGLLKEEMRRLGSLVMACADASAVPAGGALAVDRTGFSRAVTEAVRSEPLIEVVEKEITDIPEGITVIATGPLTDGVLAENIRSFFGGTEYMHFYDAAAPCVTAESIDTEHTFRASRYGKGSGDDYVNCPLDREEYDAFALELSLAEQAPVHGFEDSKVFEGCMPVEVMARRGADTLRHGPMKPVGLKDPRTGHLPWAVVQLRRDDREGRIYNIVGFQTHLKWGEQRRVFSMIPALKNAEFVRYGVMHRNSYIRSPGLLDAYFRAIRDERVFFAGQMTGVEGYIESAASGLFAGINAARAALGEKPAAMPADTATGALANYISTAVAESFQPMNVNFGIFPMLGAGYRGGRERKLAMSERALASLDAVLPELMRFTDKAAQGGV